MKKYILQNLDGYKELNSEEILNLDNNAFCNSTFKLNLLKDKEKGAKVSDTKFYIVNENSVIKFQYDEECKRLVVCPSNDVSVLKLIEALNKMDITKVEFYTTGSFNNLQKELLDSNYMTELVRKDRFLNNGTYENEVVLSKIKGEM